jgi:hypothetical protein
MRKSIVVAALLSMVAITGVGAQSGAHTCPDGTPGNIVNMAAQDACQMAADVFQMMAPQLGLALAGGNATLGRGSALGGPGHFSIGIRGNVFNGDLPQVQNFPTPGLTGAQSRTLPGKSQVLGLPTADAAIGLFGGVPLALTNVGGIDLLLSATYIPSYGDASSEVQVKPSKNLQLGYGVRVGLLQESLVVPGVSFTYLKRDLPKTTILGTSPNIDVNITDASVKTSAYRIVASKSLLLFGVAAGVGQDKYDESANVQATGHSPISSIPISFTSAVTPLAQKLTRTNYFLDLSFNLPVIKIIGEVGQVSGGTIDTFNTFSTGRADKSRTYGSLGIRLGI